MFAERLSIGGPAGTFAKSVRSYLDRGCFPPYLLQPLRVGAKFVKCCVVLECLLTEPMPQVGIVEKACHCVHQGLQIAWRYQKSIPPILDHFWNGVDDRRDDGDPEGKRFENGHRNALGKGGQQKYVGLLQ